MIAHWPLTAYGKSNREDFGIFEKKDDLAVREATVNALRDAGAFLSLRFARVPEVKAWLEARGQSGAPDEAPKTAGVPPRRTPREASTRRCRCRSACGAERVRQHHHSRGARSRHRNRYATNRRRAGRRHQANDQTEDDFVSCVSNNIGDGRDKVGVMSRTGLRRCAVPVVRAAHCAARRRPTCRSSSASRCCRRSSPSTGVRYVIWIEGSTERVDSTGSMTCSVTTTGFGCFGFLSWENDSSYEASIWDLRKGTTVGKISSDASGTSFVPAVVVPVPFIARVQSRRAAAWRTS